jgi:excisionase family DNA binding protein
MADKLECRTLTIEEAARSLGVGRNAAYEAARRGELPVVRIGRRLLVPKVALDRMLEQVGKTA